MRALLASQVVQRQRTPCNVGHAGSIPGWEDSLEEEIATPPVFLPGKSHGQRILMGCNPWGHKESDETELAKQQVSYE